jgi:hypothetical protein
MRSILIDPFTRTVTEVEYNGDFKQIYDLIQCDTYDVARINKHGDGIFIDDEGLFKETEQKFFLHEDYPQPLAGRGLVLGCNEEGESVEPHDSLMDVAAKVRWVVPVRFNGEIQWVPAMFVDMGLLKEQA